MAMVDPQQNTTANGSGVQAQYPPMPEVSDEKPLLKSLGATGTAIMSGIIISEEYNPDWYWRDGVRIVEQMLRNDGQIVAVRQAVELPILSADWKIKPASEEARDQEIAAMIESALFHEMRYTTASGRTLTQSWHDILRQILMHIFYGFMVFEVNYRIEDGFVKWSHWTPLHPRTVWRWWVGRDNELAGIQQWTFKDYSWEYIDIPADKLLHFAHRMEGNNYEGVSALRAPYKHWFYKDQFYKIDAVGIERNAVVPPVVHLPQGFTSDDVTMAQQIAKNMRANEEMGVTLPPEWDLEYPKNQQRYAANTLASIQHHDVMIARAFLAQFINLGSTETGSFALNQSQMEQFLASLQATAKYISDVINPEIKRLVDYNYNGVESYPTLECSKIVAQNISDLAEIFAKLTAGNAPLIQPTRELATWLLDQVGAPIASQNPVETQNPGSPANPDRPENGAREDDHTDEESQSVQSVAPGVGGRGGQNGGSAGASPAGAGGAAGGGEAGAAAAEARAVREEARLLRESLDAVYAGVDIVERGMVFFNPNHDARGRFAPGSGGGMGHTGSGGHGPREHHAESKERGGSSRGGTHGSGGGSGEARGGPHGGSGSSAHRNVRKEANELLGGKAKPYKGKATGKHDAELEAELRARAHREPNHMTAYEHLNPYGMHEQHGAEKMRALLTRSGTQAELRHGVGVVERVTGTRAPNHSSKEHMVNYIMHHVAGEKMPESARRAGGSRKSSSGSKGEKEAAKPKTAKAKKPTGYEQWKAEYEKSEHDLAHAKTYGEKQAALTRRINHREAHPQFSARYEREKRGQSSQPNATKTKSEKATTRPSGGKAKAAKTERVTHLTPVHHVSPRAFGPDHALNPYTVHYAYGSHQMGHILQSQSAGRLKEAARIVAGRNPGTKPSNWGSKAALLKYINEHVTSSSIEDVPSEYR